jgi:hypothetical protein
VILVGKAFQEKPVLSQLIDFQKRIFGECRA